MDISARITGDRTVTRKFLAAKGDVPVRKAYKAFTLIDLVILVIISPRLTSVP